ncbi:MAG: AarF/ABC1/UbiB kinase family protein, partial [Bacteriovoracaceae bacterium]
PALIKELKKLQDKVQPIAFDSAKEQLEESLGKKIEEVFQSIDEEPIGVASIGIVYKAKLLTGEDVVVKIKRPNIASNIRIDFEIIAFIVAQAERVSDDIKFLGISRAIDDFFKSIQLELNFLLEAQNAQTLKSNLEKVDKENIIHIPKVYRELSNEDALIMERLDGKPFTAIKDLASEAPHLEERLMKCVRMFTHNMLVDGFFHADLHGGNFFLMPDGRIGLIDFGLMGSLSRKNRTNLVAILFALVTNNYENLVYEFLDVADYDVIPNHETLQRDIRDALAPYLGLSVQETDITALTHAIVLTLSKHQIYLPREWFIIFRALMTLDGVGKSIKIDLNIFEILDDQIEGVMKDLVSKESLMEEALWIGRDAINSARIIPRHLRWLLKEFARKKYVLDVNLTGFQRELGLVSQSVYFLGLILLAVAFLFSGVFLVKDVHITSFRSIPVIVWIFWGLSLATVARASMFIKRK